MILDHPLAVPFLILLLLVGLGLLLKAGGQRLGPKFEARSLLNKSEKRLYGSLCKACPPEWSVFPQVSYGEVLRCASYKKYMRINAKRADFVICNAGFEPVAVVEYQGAGHKGHNKASRQRAEQSDRQKRRALSEAGVPMIEVEPRYTASWLRERLEEVQVRQVGSEGGSPPRRS